jgi:hypothetical protein
MDTQPLYSQENASTTGRIKPRYVALKAVIYMVESLNPFRNAGQNNIPY